MRKFNSNFNLKSIEIKQKVFERHDYEFVLDRACLQFEPDDQNYINVCHSTYEHILETKKFNILRSTRHFGPMTFYYAFNKKIDDLLLYFILNEAIDDGKDLVQLYFIIHPKDQKDIDLDSSDSLQIVKVLINN